MVLELVNDPCFGTIDTIRDIVQVPIDVGDDAIVTCFDQTLVADFPNVKVHVLNEDPVVETTAEFNQELSTTTINNNRIIFRDNSIEADAYSWDFGDPSSANNTSINGNVFTENFITLLFKPCDERVAINAFIAKPRCNKYQSLPDRGISGPGLACCRQIIFWTKQFSILSLHEIKDKIGGTTFTIFESVSPRLTTDCD